MAAVHAAHGMVTRQVAVTMLVAIATGCNAGHMVWCDSGYNITGVPTDTTTGMAVKWVTMGLRDAGGCGGHAYAVADGQGVISQM